MSAPSCTRTPPRGVGTVPLMNPSVKVYPYLWPSWPWVLTVSPLPIRRVLGPHRQGVLLEDPTQRALPGLQLRRDQGGDLCQVHGRRLHQHLLQPAGPQRPREGARGQSGVLLVSPTRFSTFWSGSGWSRFSSAAWPTGLTCPRPSCCHGDRVGGGVWSERRRGLLISQGA